MKRRTFLAAVSTTAAATTIPVAGAFESSGKSANDAEGTSSNDAEVLTGDRASPVTQRDIKRANERLLNRVSSSSATTVTKNASLVLPEPITDDGKVTVGYYVSMDGTGRVRYYHGSVPALADNVSVSSAEHEPSEAVRTIQQTVTSLADSEETAASTSNHCGYDPNDLFNNGNADEWTDEWGCPDVQGRNITRGETANNWDYKQEKKAEGILKADESLFLDKDDNGNQVLSTLSSYRLLPGAAIDSNGYKNWKLNKFEPTHDYGSNTDNSVEVIRGKPDNTKEPPSGINGFSIGAGVDSVSIGLSWDNPPNIKDKIYQDYNGTSTTSVRWVHSWSKTQATPTVFATSAAKMSDDYNDGDQVFRSEADMKVWKNGLWIWDKTSSVLADVRYFKP